MLRDRAIQRSLLLILFVSVFQPYVVLITRFGRSSECWNCFIIEQTFWTSILYIAFPLGVMCLIARKFKINSILQALIILLYFVPVSFVKLTIPLFDDRIASWSTFTNQEMWDTAMFAAIPSMGFLSCFMILALGILNKKPLLMKQNHLLDDVNNSVDRR